ncbi:MAG: hypothetical protein ACOX68_00235 [Candidatus Limivicinus sp.]|jgi:hypothetical protein
MKNEAKQRAEFYVNKKSGLIHDAVIFMVLSIVCRVIGSWGHWDDSMFLYVHILFPIVCSLLFIAFLYFLGERSLWLTSIPVILGTVFFIIRAVQMGGLLHISMSILFYMLMALLYVATVLGIVRTKWVLVTVLGLLFIYQVAVEDISVFRSSAESLLFSDGMQRLSVRCVMLGLFFTSLAIKRRKQLEDAKLPKIKDPVVIVPKKDTEAGVTAEDTAGNSDLTDAAPEVPAAPADSGEAQAAETENNTEGIIEPEKESGTEYTATENDKGAGSGEKQ